MELNFRFERSKLLQTKLNWKLMKLNTFEEVTKMGGTYIDCLFQEWFKLSPRESQNDAFWDSCRLIVWGHASKKAVDMCFIYRHKTKQTDLITFSLSKILQNY